jgi:hypothetical protein
MVDLFSKETPLIKQVTSTLQKLKPEDAKGSDL